MVNTARGIFAVTMQPGPAELDGAISRFELSKTFHGDLQGTGAGVMLSGGVLQAGAADYVAIETVDGNLRGRPASRCSSSGRCTAGRRRCTTRWCRAPAAARWTGSPASCTSNIDEDGTHRYELEYEL
jgi:hypothetical protein